MSRVTPSEAIDREFEDFSVRLAGAEQLFARQKERIGDLKFMADEAGLARDKALYWLLRICEAAEREKWQMSEDAEQCVQHAVNLLADNNIFTGLPEPDNAILRLMEIVTPDLEAAEEGAK